ncbi:hypothetical protein CTAYLR_009702 [Chrysophaeum taylorii]|uniref:Uncharacterized protein n=1 Tax=Chrysophaeum taylorii TaxID=2483200 RepID=A0AAD7U9D2_9STRA|nr:hypothetical protein CTAYLR_009702 [Chrysophaeum taylorii]
MSIGGWDAAHPNSTVASGSEWWSLFEAYGGGVFDGIDWDLEGFDNLDSPYNKVNFSTLELIHDMSASAKAAGAVVSLVPPQSYFDVTESRFDLRLTNTYLDFKPDFRYRGRNTYAPLVVWNASLYDFVDLQLYESWSRAAQAIEQLDWDPAAYLAALVGAMERGWTVDFGAGVARVAVEPKKLVLGFSRGSDSDPEKSVYIDPSAAAAAFAALPPDRRFRGVMFWNAHLDGGPCWLPNGTQITCDFAAGFNNFLHVR